jgi:peptidoglycan/xylan/chitin deacetylase (PgdA/CDA1 family)
MHKRIEVFVAGCFYYSGLVKLVLWWKQRSRPSLAILIYHHATGGDLRQHILYLRRHYRILHLEAALEELYSARKSKHEMSDRRVPLVLTFDDGYYDNYTHAFAFARELQVPITIFLIPGYIENGHRFWWDEGIHLVSQAQVCEARIEGRTYHLDELDERKALAQAIYTRVRHAASVSEREEFLVSVRKALAVPSLVTAEEKATLPLTRTEVQEMEQSGWVSFGAHTMHHPILAYLRDPAEAQYEVSECRAVLEGQLGHPVRAFAYPVGESEHIGENGPCTVREASYDWAVTALPGFNTAQTNPYLLHRLMVDVDQHWLVVAAKASGVWGFFSRLYWVPITFVRKLLR